jgi:hypothetical protein
VTPYGIEVDEAKIEATKSWLIPATLTQLQSFLGLVGFYRGFVRDFSSIVAPLNDMMKKGVFFHLGHTQDQAFRTLINELSHAPLHEHAGTTQMVEGEGDAFRFEERKPQAVPYRR